eukprot:4678760-Amphidinium_carterae.1
MALLAKAFGAEVLSTDTTDALRRTLAKTPGGSEAGCDAPVWRGHSGQPHSGMPQENWIHLPSSTLPG